MTFANNDEFETRVSAVIGTTDAWYVVDPDLETDPEMYNEFSALGCDICNGGAGSVTTCRIVAGTTDVECDICGDCRYALEYGYETE